MKLLLALTPGGPWDVYFPPMLMERLRAEYDFREARVATGDEDGYIAALADAEAVITHWDTPKATSRVLDACPSLRLIAHAAGSVVDVCSDAVFERGLTVLSANGVMCRYVAEWILGATLASLRDMPMWDARTRAGTGWNHDALCVSSLYGARVGFVGLGMVGRSLLALLKPFGVTVNVYDPYIPDSALADWPFASRVGSIGEAVEGADVVSIHVSKTRETLRLVGAEAISHMKKGALLVNAARGAVLDTDALVAALREGRIRAAIDVYDGEPIGTDHPLMSVDGAMLSPHMAGLPATWHMTEAILDDVSRFARGEPVRLGVTRKQYELMTHEKAR